MWKMDPMSGFDIRLVFTLPPRESTLQYKRCVNLWNNFPCITALILCSCWVITDTKLQVVLTIIFFTTFVLFPIKKIYWFNYLEKCRILTIFLIVAPSYIYKSLLHGDHIDHKWPEKGLSGTVVDQTNHIINRGPFEIVSSALYFLQSLVDLEK